MKKFRFLKLLPLCTLFSLTSCNFFLLNPYRLVNGDGSSEKQELSYSLNDLAANSSKDVDYTPSIGKPKILYIPIWFTDSDDFITTQKKQQIWNDINTMAFGDEETTGWHSVKSYYYEDSYGLCDIEGSVSDWYKCGYSYTALSKVEKVQEVVDNAIEDWKTNNPTLVQEYDTDHNGYLDGVICVYGCPYYQQLDEPYQTNLSNTMWAYTSWLGNTSNVNNPKGKQFIWASYSFMYNSDSRINIDAHTFIHETGHLFGLEDYYDYNQVGTWAGAFSMQDYNVGGHDPYSKLALGWVKPYVPTESSTITIKSFAESGDLILLTPNYTASPFDEYLLLELYTPTGLNQYDSRNQYKFNDSNYPVGPSIPGIRIWHVDSRLIRVSGWKTNSGTITTSIQNGSRYYIGNANTSYVLGGAYNDYASNVTEFKEMDYKLLELIRRGDYSHTSAKFNSSLGIADLFRSGHTFSIDSYSEYFRNNGKFDNGYDFNCSIRVMYVSNTSATIEITL